MNLSSHDYFLFDYADVVSFPQDMERFQEMAILLNMNLKDFHREYWKYRRAYDQGQKGEDYWASVAGRTLETELLSTVILTDCEGWGRINPLSINILKKLKQMKVRTGLLSNLPIELVHFMQEERDFLPLFDDIFFSAEINLVKPDKEIYEYVLRKVKVKPEKMIFFDDRAENLDGARSLGMETFLITQKSILELSEQIDSRFLSSN